MKKLCVFLICIFLVIDSSMCAFAMSINQDKNIDKLYAEAYESVKRCKDMTSQDSINWARVAVGKLIGVADWAVGEFSKQIDEAQNEILVIIVQGISCNKQNPQQGDIEWIREFIEKLPVDSWKQSYSSALDQVQNILINKAIDLAQKYHISKSENDKKVIVRLLKDMRTSSNVDVSNFVQNLAKQYGLDIENATMTVTRVLDHSDPLYDYYKLYNHEYLVEVDKTSYEEAYEVLSDLYRNNEIRDYFETVNSDGKEGYTFFEALLPSCDKHDKVMLIIDCGKFLENEVIQLRVHEKSKKSIYLAENIVINHHNIKGVEEQEFTHNYIDTDYAVQQIARVVERNSKWERYSGLFPSYISDDISEYLAVMQNMNLIDSKYSDYYRYYNNGEDYSYSAFKDIKSIEDVQKVINKIDDEVRWVQGEYDKLFDIIPDGLVFNDAENLTVIVNKIIGDHYKIPQGMKIGLSTNQIYDDENDIGYVYNEDSGEYELRKGEVDTQFKPYLIIGRHGIYIASKPGEVKDGQQNMLYKYVTLNVSKK